MSSSGSLGWYRKEELPNLSIKHQYSSPWEEDNEEDHLSAGDEVDDIQEEGKAASTIKAI